MTRPVIGVGARRIRPGRISGWRDGATAVASQYLEAVEHAGGRGVLLPPLSSEEDEALDLLQRFDGLLLTGGGDIDPTLYGAERHPETDGVSERRDTSELVIARAALEVGMPFLAICRGLQVLNVSLGGTLIQHLPDVSTTAHRGAEVPDAQEHIKVEGGSRLAEALGTQEVEGSGSHHQAVERLGEGLRAVAWAEDGLIEGVEHDEGWVVAVQWHPERTAAEDPVQQRLFDAFVERCRA